LNVEHQSYIKLERNCMSNASPKLHNAMWPGLVGKGTDEGQEPPISLEKMLDLTAAADINGQKFEGIDYFLFLPHTNPEATDDELKKIADLIASKGFNVGSLVAPVWPGTIGDSAMGDDEQQGKFLSAVKMACRIARIFNEHGVRKYGCIRIDSAEFGVAKWKENPGAGTARIVETFKEAAKIAADSGERLAAEGEICWAGMHSAGKTCWIFLKAWACLSPLAFRPTWRTPIYTRWVTTPRTCFTQRRLQSGRILCRL
jgi:sugar phosphate isomerase/epimerase